MKNILFFLLFIAAFATIDAKQYIKADIDFTDGTNKTMYVGFPINFTAKSFSVKSSEDAKATKLDAASIKMITFSDGEGLVNLVYSGYKRFRIKEGEKVFKNKIWLVMMGGCKDILALYNASKYKIKQGKVLLEYSSNKEFYYFLKKSNEDNATIISLNNQFHTFVVGGDAFFRANAKRLFSDNPALVEKIESKYYEGDIFKLLEEYCKE